MAHSETLNELESEVTCPLCHDIFKEPKQLGCNHVYCKQCLHGLAVRSTLIDRIRCPECRGDNTMPPNRDVSFFATPHRVNRLVEMYQRSLKRAKTEEMAKPVYCKEHESQPLALYCETCESLVCRECVIDSCSKKSHNFEYLKKYEADFDKKLEPLQALHQKMSTAMEAISTAEKKLAKRKKEKLQQVRSTFDELSQILVVEEDYFRESVKESFEKQEKINAAKKEEISGVMAKLQSVTESTKSSLLQPNFHESLVNQTKIIEEIRDLASNVSTDPAIVPDPEVELTSPEQFLEQWRASSFLYKSGDPLKSHLHGHYLDLDVPVNQTASYVFDVDVQSIKRKKVSFTASLLCRRDGTSEAVAVEKITPEQYSLSFVPQKRGRHELHIMYNDTHICGSPIPVYVTIPPQQLKKAISTMELEADDSIEIDCYGDKVYAILTKAGCIAVLDPLTGSTEKLIKVRGVINTICVTQEHIFAADTEQDRLMKMDKNGTVLKSVGGEGDSPGEFQGPDLVQLNREREICVCDSTNRIQVFDDDLSLIKVIRIVWKEDLDVAFLVGMAFDEAGYIYVTPHGPHRIHVLDPDGKHIRSFGESIWRDSITMHRDFLYVNNMGADNLSVFQPTGEFVASFSRGVPYVQSLAIDEDGYVYTASRGKIITTF